MSRDNGTFRLSMNGGTGKPVTFQNYGSLAAAARDADEFVRLGKGEERNAIVTHISSTNLQQVVYTVTADAAVANA